MISTIFWKLRRNYVSKKNQYKTQNNNQSENIQSKKITAFMAGQDQRGLPGQDANNLPLTHVPDDSHLLGPHK